jgi:predicted nucleic-acid-binding Zn-ribbon protein
VRKSKGVAHCLLTDYRTSLAKELKMIQCPKCENDTRTSSLITAQGAVMLAGTIGTDPQPIMAQVCTACGFIELYAPIPLEQPQATHQAEELPDTSSVPEAITATA